MGLHEDIAWVAYELYEMSGCIPNRDVDNWLKAEQLVLARHSANDEEEIVSALYSVDDPEMHVCCHIHGRKATKNMTSPSKTRRKDSNTSAESKKRRSKKPKLQGTDSLSHQ